MPELVITPEDQRVADELLDKVMAELRQNLEPHLAPLDETASEAVVTWARNRLQEQLRLKLVAIALTPHARDLLGGSTSVVGYDWTTENEVYGLLFQFYMNRGERDEGDALEAVAESAQDTVIGLVHDAGNTATTLLLSRSSMPRTRSQAKEQG